jgi:acetate kinase
MKVLCINAGSSTVKFQLFEMPEERVLVSSNFEKIGESNGFYSIKINGEKIEEKVDLKDHEDAIRIFLNELINLKVISNFNDISAVGHRVVQGADKYSKGTIVTDEVLKDIKSFIPLAPLHNKANLLGINVSMKLLPDAKDVVVFDTAFHQTMEEEQYIYPVPYKWYENYGVRRYGFHGTSHKYLVQSISSILNKKELKVITCHLGSGCSISAIKDGKVVATSMGLTPLGGIAMTTRCGDIDPSIISYVMKKSGKSIDEIINDLNKKSGMYGICGVGPDHREIETNALNGDKLCILAENLFANRIVSFIANYYVLLNKPDVIVFSAGIGTNAPLVRKRIIDKLACLNIFLDEEANNARSRTQKISSDKSEVLCYVIPTDEEVMIARETYAEIERLSNV